jgi:(4S)-4-hydroxy-5-phosphonooxypentane-2,3-dione isomerase
MRFQRIVLAVAFSTIASVAVAADEKPSPIVAEVKANLKDASKPFTMLVFIQVKEGAEEKFEAAFAKAIAGTRKEKGNLAYQLNRDVKKRGAYIVYERWQNLAALAAHMKTDHIATLRSETGELRVGASEVKVFVPAGE